MSIHGCPDGCAIHDCLRCGGAHPHVAGPHACPGCGHRYPDLAVYHGRYGTVTVADHGIAVYAIEPETYDWAHRPGACWPGSDLSSTTVHADFDHTGLVDLIRREDDDLSASELLAWAFDAVQDAVPADIAGPWLRVIDPGYGR